MGTSCPTSTSALPLTPLAVAVTVVVPSATDVTSPVPSTLAIAPFNTDQLTVTPDITLPF